jgi:hypothetical protein
MIGIASQSKLTLSVLALLSSVVISLAQETIRPDGARSAHRISLTCANRHVQLLTLIEDLGEAPNFAGDKLFKALVATLQASDVCASGNEHQALSLYDRAALDLVFSVASVR